MFFVIFLGIQNNIVFINPALKTINKAEAQVSNISVIVIVDNIIFNLSFNKGNSLYDALYEAREQGQITFTGEQYYGLGFFVTDIGSLHKNKNKNLMYYINGEEAKVGISSYIPKDGDIISWKLE